MLSDTELVPPSDLDQKGHFVIVRDSTGKATFMSSNMTKRNALEFSHLLKDQNPEIVDEATIKQLRTAAGLS